MQKDMKAMLAEFEAKGGKIKKIKAPERLWLFNRTIKPKGWNGSRRALVSDTNYANYIKALVNKK